MSGIYLFAVAAAIILITSQLDYLAVLLFLFAVLNLITSMRTRLSLGRANILALTGHIIASVVSYILLTRIFWIPYRTDSIVATELGVQKVLLLQNPYAYSIKSLMDQLGFPTSYYTPHLDGSYEFHLTYGALNFLSLIPTFVAGLHDLRDSVFIFHTLSVLIVFLLVPPKQKALSLTPFVFFPIFVAASWTDAVWAFYLLLCPALWYRSRNLGLLMLAFAGASKQIALIAAPLLLIRVWRESPNARVRNTLLGLGTLVGGFLGPNLPFIIASPSEWWASTIVPFLPSGGVMVSGGLGLSEILLHFGAAPPAIYFVILMGVLGGFLLYLYGTRFWRSRCLVWALPALTMVFYYRSLPNYMFYWTFPLGLEYFRGNPTLSMWPVSPFNTNQTLSSLLAVVRPSARKFRVWIIAGLVITTVVLGFYGTYVSRLPPSMVNVRVNSFSDPDQIGEVTTLNVTLDNVTPLSIRPIFFVKWGIWLSNRWASNSNQTLSQSASASYVVSAIDSMAAVPRSSSFRLFVYDANTGHQVGSSSSITPDVSEPNIANPLFKWWTLDPSAGTRVPFDWSLALQNVDRNTALISSLDDFQGSGIVLNLNNTKQTESLEKITISQDIPLSSTTMKMLLSHRILASSILGADLGVTVTDGTHELSYIFSDTSTRQVLGSSPTSETISLPVSSSWSTLVSIDANHDWRALGWSVPYRITFSIFLMAHEAGFYSAGIKELSCPGCFDFKAAVPPT